MDEKAEGAKVKKQLDDAIEQVLHTGNLMANICFNCSQEGWTVSDKDRAVMKRMQVDWDKRQSFLRGMMPKRTSK